MRALPRARKDARRAGRFGRPPPAQAPGTTSESNNTRHLEAPTFGGAPAESAEDRRPDKTRDTRVAANFGATVEGASREGGGGMSRTVRVWTALTYPAPDGGAGSGFDSLRASLAWVLQDAWLYLAMPSGSVAIMER